MRAFREKAERPTPLLLLAMTAVNASTCNVQRCDAVGLGPLYVQAKTLDAGRPEHTLCRKLKKLHVQNSFSAQRLFKNRFANDNSNTNPSKWRPTQSPLRRMWNDQSPNSRTKECRNSRSARWRRLQRYLRCERQLDTQSWS